MGEDSGKADSAKNDGEQNDNKTMVNDKNKEETVVNDKSKEENVSGTGSSELPGKVEQGKDQVMEQVNEQGKEQGKEHGKKQRTQKSFHVSNTKFDLPPRTYRLIRPIGFGAYGLVVSAEDCKKKRKVAIKKIGRAFDDLVDGKRILREIKLLRHIKHDNVIGILDIVPPRSLKEFQDVYIVSTLMETDLNRIIYSKQPLSTDHVQYFIYQVLRALKYLHSANIFHRDLKPSNLLLNSNCDLQVCDLGLARGVDEGEKGLTEYVVTRWYRAPEIMLSCKEYSKAIDVWSTGCIFAELFERKPFFPGDDYIHQLKLICEKVGHPDEDELHFITSPRAKRFILSLPGGGKRTIKEFVPNAPETALDLLDKMLQFNPNSRITVDDALAHPFMKSLHNVQDEPESESLFEFEYEKEELSKERLQRLVWNEILHYHPDLKEMKEEKGKSADAKDDASVGGADRSASPGISKSPHSETSSDHRCSHLGEEFVQSTESPFSKKQRVA